MQNICKKNTYLVVIENILTIAVILGLGFQRYSVAFGSILWGIALLCMVLIILFLYKSGGVSKIQERIAPFKSYYELIGLFFLLLIPQIIVSPHIDTAFSKSYGLFFWRMMPFLVGTLLLPKKYIKRIFIVVSIIYIIESLVIIYQYFEIHMNRPNGFGANPLYVALQMAMVYPLYLILALDHRLKKKWRLVALIALVFIAVALLFNNSRSAWVCIGIVTVLLTILYSREDKKTALIGVLVLLGAGLVIIHYPHLIERLSSIENISTNGSNMARLAMWNDGLHIIADHPLVGTTSGAFREIYEKHYFIPRPYMKEAFGHLHNNYIQLWAEYGVFSWIGYYALTTYFIVRNIVDYIKGKNPYALMIVMLVFVYSVYGIFEYAIYHTANNKIYWFLLGSLLLYKKEYVENAK